MSRSREDIKNDIAKLVQEYAELTNRERLEAEEPVYVVGWIVSAEYETTSLMQESSTATLNIYPETQPRSMSRGLYEMGADKYHER